MDVNQVSVQLFHQPSLSASYLRNNRAMNAFDFTLSFPGIPLQFKLSSDLASGWSKLIYEQVLMNKNQQKLEVEIQGLTEKEGFIVEECVKLLFGFKVEVCMNDIWQFLKICEILGITQSPQNECETVQEILLKFVREHIQQMNLIEGWDYVVHIVENGGEGLLVHRSEIRQLAQQIMEKIKQIIIDSKFEILLNYAHNLEQSQDSGESLVNNQNINKFLIKDLKREHYIQLRTMLFSFLNHQVGDLTNSQNIVRVLFEELDNQYELDGYINKYFEGITQRLAMLDSNIQTNQKNNSEQLIEINEQLRKSVETLTEKNRILQNQLMLAHAKIDSILDMKITMHCQMNIFCYNNGIVKVIGVGNIHTLNQNSIQAINRIKDHIVIGTEDGDVYIFDSNDLKLLNTHKPLSTSSVKKIFILNNYVLISYEDGQLIILWNEKLIFQQKYGSTITCIYKHHHFGSFIVFGDALGCIYFIYINETKPKLSADVIKQFKNNPTRITHIVAHSQSSDLILIAHVDYSICIWNWEQEQLITTMQIDSKIIDMTINYDYLRILLQNGHLEEYSLNQNYELNEAIFLSDDVLSIYENTVLTKNGIIHKLDQKSTLSLTNYYLHPQSTYTHHLETCIYGLLLLNYPQCASSADDKTIVLFNLRNQDKLILRGHQAYVRAIALLQGEKHIISGSYDTTIKIWELQTGIQYNTLTGHTKPVLCISVLHHTYAMCVSGGEDGILRGWNWRTAMCIWKLDIHNEVWSLLSITDHQTILSGNKDGSIRVISTGQNGEKSQSILELKIHKSFVNCLMQLEDSIIASGSSDFSICIVDFKTGLTIRTLAAHQNIVWSISIIDEDIIASSSTEGKVKMWNWRTGQCLNSQVVGKGSIYTLLRIPNTNKLIGGTATGEIVQWKINKLPLKQINEINIIK